jgi:serine/threonine-protein kinase HipA
MWSFFTIALRFAHADRDTTGSYSYEQLILLSRQLGLGQNSITELFRRAVFND